MFKKGDEIYHKRICMTGIVTNVSKTLYTINWRSGKATNDHEYIEEACILVTPLLAILRYNA